MENKHLTEKESLALITDMINKTKQSFHDTGFGPLLWGCVITICGLLSYLEQEFNFKLPFDHWSLVLVAVVPQVWHSISQGKKQTAKTYNDIALDYTWIAFGISMGIIAFVVNGLVFDIPKTEAYVTARQNFRIGNHITGFYLIIYAIPTFITGGIMKFKPMLFGGILCWALALASVWTNYKYDMLFTAVAATCAWLIPGIIINANYRKLKKAHGNV